MQCNLSLPASASLRQRISHTRRLIFLLECYDVILTSQRPIGLIFQIWNWSIISGNCTIYCGKSSLEFVDMQLFTDFVIKFANHEISFTMFSLQKEPWTKSVIFLYDVENTIFWCYRMLPSSSEGQLFNKKMEKVFYMTKKILSVS